MVATFKFWTPERDAILGTMPDAKAAKIIGRSEGCIQWRRVTLGIPAYGKSCRMDEFPGTRFRLGREPDAQIAKDIGVSKATVRAYRRARAIPACGRQVARA